jgi:hypothetical protein
MKLTLSSATMAVPTIAYSNDIYVNQVGDDLTLSVTQDGEDNSIGTSSTPISLNGDNVDVTLIQETNGASINLSVDGDDNTMVVKQKCHNGSLCNSDNMDIDITGNNNGMELGQGYKIADSWIYDYVEHGGHDMDLEVNGSNNNIRLSQRSQNNISDHNMDVNIYSDDNNVHVMQEANQDKTLSLTINNDDNNVFVHQKKSHAHTATISIDGNYGTDLSLTQSSTSGAMSYSLTQNCQTFGGCSVSVTQN